MIFLRSKIYTITLGALAALAIFFCSNSVKGSVVMADNGPQTNSSKESHEFYKKLTDDNSLKELLENYSNLNKRYKEIQEFLEVKFNELDDTEKEEALTTTWLKMVEDVECLAALIENTSLLEELWHKHYEACFDKRLSFYSQFFKSERQIEVLFSIFDLSSKTRKLYIDLRKKIEKQFSVYRPNQILIDKAEKFAKITTSSEKDSVKVVASKDNDNNDEEVIYSDTYSKEIPISMFLGGDGIKKGKEKNLHILVGKKNNIQELKISRSENGAPIYLWIDKNAHIDKLEATGKVFFVLLGHTKDKYKDKKVVFSDEVEVIEIPNMEVLFPLDR